MNKQEVFDKAVAHLLSMSKPCQNEQGDCSYGSSTTSMCVVSIFARNDKERKEWDNHADSTIKSLHEAGISLPKVINDHIDLMIDLQGLHDFGYVWYDSGFHGSHHLEVIAKKHGLTYNP